MKNTDRLKALHILIKLLDERVPLSHSLTAETSPFTKELCFGVCRHYFRLQALAQKLVEKKPKTTDIWLIILLGLYQLHYLAKPDYAVVQESVALANQINKSWAKGLINAVLRRFCREKANLLANIQSEKDFLYNHPQWLLARLQQAWPQDWQTIVAANDSHPPLSLRVNRQRGSRDAYLHRLAQAGMGAHALTFASEGIVLDSACDVSQLPGFAQGDVSVQDEAAQLAVSLLDLHPGLRILDACCAPGGKTCHIMETETNLDCTALDVDAKRLQRVRENIARCGVQAQLVQGDAANPSAWWDGVLYDRILLDAPCSASGVIRRHPDIKLLRTPEEIAHVVLVQQKLLRCLWPLLKAGGLLLYATCSIMPEENEQQMANFIAEHPDCQCDTTLKPWGRTTGHGWQILPGDHNQDGFFYSVLRKEE